MAILKAWVHSFILHVVPLTKFPQPLSKTSSPQSTIWCFLFHFPISCLFSLMSSNCCLRLFPRLPVTSSPYLSLSNVFKRQFLNKPSQIQLVFRLFVVCRIFLSSLSHFNTFTAIVDLSRFNNSCLKSPASTLVDLTFQLRALRSFSLNQLRNLSL